MYDLYCYPKFHTDKSWRYMPRMSDFDCKVTAFLGNGEKNRAFGRLILNLFMFIVWYSFKNHTIKLCGHKKEEVPHH